MNPLSAQILLSLWEEHHDADPIQRALAVLAAAWPGCAAAVWAQVPIGQRDGWLRLLNDSLFGATIRTTARCPQCGERVESTFCSSALFHLPPPPAPSEPVRFALGGYAIDFRLPHSDDLLRVAAADDAPARLLQRCILAIHRDGRAVDAAQLPPALGERLAGQMAERDPDADIRVALTCPTCQHGWTVLFDILRHFWDELADWAQRTLVDVHLLAATYGWAEADVLAMSARRRAGYVAMVRA